jgi:hypothetical protein
MVRRLHLPRLAVALCLVPCTAVLAVACGGSDVVDSPDAADQDAGVDATTQDGDATDSTAIPDVAVDSGAKDTSLADSKEAPDAGDAHTPESGLKDGEVGDTALEDADGGREDADADAELADAADANRMDATLTDSGSIGPEAGQDAESGTLVESGSADAGLEAGVDAEAGMDAGLEAESGIEAGEAGLDLLGSAKTFAVLAGQTITITPSPPATVIIGNVGVSPGTAIVTLPPGQPVGTVYAGGPVAAQAQSDLTAAYNTLAGMPCLPANIRTGVDLGGKTLAPGVYCFPNTSAGITGDLVLDAQQDPNAVWVIQVGTTLTTGTGSTVSVINGGSACNVYWQIGSSATLGTGTQFVGNIVALTSISLVTGSTVLVGRTLARNGSVSLEGDTISAGSCQ